MSIRLREADGADVWRRSLQVRLDLTVVCDEVADRLGLDTAIHTYIQYYEATSQDSKTVCSILETVDVSLD